METTRILPVIRGVLWMPESMQVASQAQKIQPPSQTVRKSATNRIKEYYRSNLRVRVPLGNTHFKSVIFNHWELIFVRLISVRHHILEEFTMVISMIAKKLYTVKNNTPLCFSVANLKPQSTP